VNYRVSRKYPELAVEEDSAPEPFTVLPKTKKMIKNHENNKNKMSKLQHLQKI